MPIYFFHIFFYICIYWTPVYDEDTFLPGKTLNQVQIWIVRKMQDFLKGMCGSIDAWNVFECDPSKLVLIRQQTSWEKNMFYCLRNRRLDMETLCWSIFECTLVYLERKERHPHLFHCFGEIILPLPQPAISIKLAISRFPQNWFLCFSDVMKGKSRIFNFQISPH